MTRRGSLAYYLAAWVCGCAFMSFCVWAKISLTGAEALDGPAGVISLLFAIFYGLMYTAPAVLLSAFLLRCIAHIMKSEKAWQWMLLGAGITTLLFAALGWLGGASQADMSKPVRYFADIFSVGPSMVFSSGWWLAIPAGAVTAWVLFRTDRAFGASSGDSAA
ncbi:MAG TPA: hypothetical protein VGR81_10755 [Candidatus Acidoferrales bacterium]|nr:hypothetical protein [Candidatus Acidoferrales bacterium]